MINLHQEAIVKVNIHASDVKTFMSKEMIETIIEMTTKNLRATLNGIKDFDFLDKVSDEPLVLTSGGLLQLNIVRETKHDKTKHKDDPTNQDNEYTPPFSNHVSYIMDRVLEILVGKSKKILNKDFIITYCHYMDKKKKPAELLDFRGVDASKFSEFELKDTCAWKIIKAIDKPTFVEYLIMDIKTGIGLALITITKTDCIFNIINTSDDPIMLLAFHEIKELCKIFNHDKNNN